MKIQHISVPVVSGRDGFPCYRIPGITVTAKGTLLLYYECRNGGDWSVSEIRLLRSEDGGRTWEEGRRIGDGKGKNTVNNPVMTALPDGTVVYVYMENYKRAFRAFSFDDGRTFTDETEITEVFESVRPTDPWSCIAAGPGHGLCTSEGKIVVPVWLAWNPANIFEHCPSRTATIVSDDGGKTFRLGEEIPYDREVWPGESCLAELPGGLIRINTRNISPKRRRLTAVSRNGESGWTEADYDDRLPDPCCAAGLTQTPDFLLYSHCNSTEDRIDLTVKKLAFDGTVLEELPVYGKAGYSDIVYDPLSGKAYCAFETDGNDYIRVAEIEL